MNVPYMNVYSAEEWHCTVHIVGNREALRQLREQIDDLLTDDSGEVAGNEKNYFANDGEGYHFILLRTSTDVIYLMKQHYISDICTWDGFTVDELYNFRKEEGIIPGLSDDIRIKLASVNRQKTENIQKAEKDEVNEGLERFL